MTEQEIRAQALRAASHFGTGTGSEAGEGVPASAGTAGARLVRRTLADPDRRRLLRALVLGEVVGEPPFRRRRRR